MGIIVLLWRRNLVVITDSECCDIFVHISSRQVAQGTDQSLQRYTLIAVFNDLTHRRILAFLRILGSLFEALAVEGIRQAHHAGLIHTSRVNMRKALRPDERYKVFEGLSNDLIGQQDMSLIAVTGEQPKRMNADGLKHLIILLHGLFIAVVKIQRYFFRVLRRCNRNLAFLRNLTGLGQSFFVVVIGIDRVIHAHRIPITHIQPAFQDIHILIAQLPSIIAVAVQNKRDSILITSQRAKLYASIIRIIDKTWMYQFEEIHNRGQLLLLLGRGKSQSINLNAIAICHSQLPPLTLHHIMPLYCYCYRCTRQQSLRAF